MKLEDYQLAWRTAAAPTPARREVEILIGSMSRSERRGRILLGACAVNTAVAALFTVGVLVRGPVAWKEMLPALALQVLLAVALVGLIRHQRDRRRAFESAAMTVREATRAALDNVNSRIRDMRLMLALACVVVPMLALIVNQLIASGKMNTQAALSFASVCALIIGGNALIQWRKYRRTLVPQRAQLEHILMSLKDEA